MIRTKAYNREPFNRRDVVFAISGGVLFSASQPPFIAAFLAYFCLIPLFSALRGKGYAGAFFLAYLWGFSSNLLSLYWIAIPTFGGMLAAVVILSLYNALFGLVFSFFERRSLPLALAASPFVWVAMEFVRGFGRLGFPWMDLGYTQGSYPVVIQIADIIGHRGISLSIVAINALILAIIIAKKRRWLPAAILIILILTILGYGIWRLEQPPAEDNIEAAIVQTNIGADQKWEGALRRRCVKYCAEMLDSVESDLDLVVLPETAIPYYLRDYPRLINELGELSERCGAPIVIGTLDYDPARREKDYFNSSTVITPGGISGGYYHKMELVPMSEQMPFQEFWPALRELDLGGSHFSRGTEAVVFEVDGPRFSTPICFEIVFPRSARAFARGGAQFLVNITNDGWFGSTPGPYQHANFCRFRAVENRFGIARAAQTGISLIINEKGIITNSLGLNLKGVIVGDVPMGRQATFFTRMGDWVSIGGLVATPLLMLIAGLALKT